MMDPDLQLLPFLHSSKTEVSLISGHHCTVPLLMELLRDSLGSSKVASRLQSWETNLGSLLQLIFSKSTATPHAMTGTSPFELMHRRKMRTKLNIHSPPPATTPEEDVRNRVSSSQAHMKQYCDTRRGARTPSFKEGDRVRVRKPGHVKKGHPRFSPPIRINKQVGPSTYTLEDGKTWHASHLAPVNATSDELPVQPRAEMVKPELAQGTVPSGESN